MQSESLRWALPDLNSALIWCKGRNDQGICCTMDVLGEDIKTEKEVEYSLESILNCARSLENQTLDAAIAVKLTSLGALLDKKMARRNIFKLYNETSDLNINLEIDMEGTPLVEYTIKTALALADAGYPITMALQAYLNRTQDDIENVLGHEITVRLVKGAYMGDSIDFVEIQNMYKNCLSLLIDSDRYFSVCTHDPELINWIMDQVDGQKNIFEFGFLKGLADETKLELVKSDWQVSEYVPFGLDTRAYVKRRERYLKMLEVAGREPIS